MNRGLALSEILVNFAYADEEIQKEEREKIQELGKKYNIPEQCFEYTFLGIEKESETELQLFQEALIYLNQELNQKEKVELFHDIIKIVIADRKVTEREIRLCELLERIWEVKS